MREWFYCAMCRSRTPIEQESVIVLHPGNGSNHTDFDGLWVSICPKCMDAVFDLLSTEVW
ncbi:hypothetical protein AGATL06_28500 [Agathobaculum sp. TL06]